ncbi:hypothetical protein CDAR_79311 [Caerostris darwini]|uniref:Uncharacterized protein n=1 Tax=Caerostris darwini TaxID=1538125 RepID=A0AAV4TYI0_9ARAC|nr:hypothetical protein CDAR_79311 [Caerostris darwini]
MNLDGTSQINFTCDAFETYPSKEPPFFCKTTADLCVIQVAGCFIDTDHVERRTWNLCLVQFIVKKIHYLELAALK